MNGFNQATICGNLGRDAELKFTAAGTAVATISVATTEHWTDKSSGQRKEKTEWHRCIIWGKTAESLAEYLTKGKPVLVQGRIQTREWTDKDGIKRKTTEINADKVVLLGSKNDSNGSKPKPASPSPDADDVTDTAVATDAVNDDDIPF